ncbi:MAG: NrfD/PsrC family molybdoenzyme membrane anchor subunit [Melioribacteraceae bacterium]|nr:NrfD/PsrC family molybdoenzyme membrane anchor subunit [Melioribacteraceae bacterium]
MHEITSTRSNHLIDPTLQRLGMGNSGLSFLGGMVAGMMIITGYFLFKQRQDDETCSCRYVPWVSLVLLSLGMFALFLDLEHKLFTWRLYTTFQVTSPMSWGAWILIIVYPAIFVTILITPPKWLVEKFPIVKKYSDWLNERKMWIKNIGVANMILGAMLGMYTGILLSSLGARPLWNTSILWLLFLVSGLSGAAAFVHMVAKNVYERELLAKADNGFLTFELFVIGLMIIGLLTSTQVHQDAAMLILSGPFAATFWVFVVGIGIVIPLIIQLMAVNHKVNHTPWAPIMVIVGGLILRFVIVEAGQVSSWF